MFNNRTPFRSLLQKLVNTSSTKAIRVNRIDSGSLPLCKLQVPALTVRNIILPANEISLAARTCFIYSGYHLKTYTYSGSQVKSSRGKSFLIKIQLICNVFKINKGFYVF